MICVVSHLLEDKRLVLFKWAATLLCLEMAMGTRNPMGFYPIRVRVWVNFHTHGFVNGHKCIPDGFMGTDLFL